MASGLVGVVSTIKDTPANVQRYVERNLAGGVDHLVVFLDDGDQEVRAALAGHPHVTCVPGGPRWWQGDRPAQLNDRQRINANAGAAALARAGGFDWVFHVDGDEVVRVDRDRLSALPADARAVRLGVREAVSQVSWEQPPRWFKRPLGEADLVLLTQLGVIERPSNGALLHGHADGKSGVRPGGGVWLTLHDPVDADGSGVDIVEDDAFAVLHFESWSGEEFVRKWIALAGAGPGTKFRPGRQPTLVAVQALLARGLPTEVTERYLLRLFERSTADDLATLRDLGLAEEIDPDAGPHTPASLTDEQRSGLGAALEEIRSGDKSSYRPPAGRPTDRGEADQAKDAPKDGMGRRARGLWRS